MTKLILVRHGESEWNKTCRIQGHSDPELTELGREQAYLTADRLSGESVKAVYSSDLTRARATAEIIARSHGLDVTVTELLREANLGRWEGLTQAQAAEQYPEEFRAYRADPVANRPPGAERLEAVIARCRAFVDAITKLHDYKCTIVAVGHGGSVRGVIAAVYGLSPDVYRRIRLDNGGITILYLKDGKPLLATLNDTCHLTAQRQECGLEEG
jgi:broad specificity phosphatase PhoE